MLLCCAVHGEGLYCYTETVCICGLKGARVNNEPYNKNPISVPPFFFALHTREREKPLCTNNSFQLNNDDDDDDDGNGGGGDGWLISIIALKN